MSRVLALTFLLAVVAPGSAQSPSVPATPTSRANDLELVQKLTSVRKDYQTTLEQLRQTYLTAGDMERAKWAEDELRQFHRIPKNSFRLELDVPPPTLGALSNVPEANQLFVRAMSYKDKGWNTELVDNQRRTEILLQELLAKYPQATKVSDAAYMLGDLYEKHPYKMYRKAATYFERCFQWNPTTPYDARLRAARLYDRQALDRTRAVELYRDAASHTSDTRVLQETQRRLAELAGSR